MNGYLLPQVPNLPLATSNFSWLVPGGCWGALSPYILKPTTWVGHEGQNSQRKGGSGSDGPWSRPESPSGHRRHGKREGAGMGVRPRAASTCGPGQSDRWVSTVAAVESDHTGRCREAQADRGQC